MTQVLWNPLGQATSQTVTGTVSGVTTGAVLTATINSKTVTYTCLASDTNASAATAFTTNLQSSSAPAEFQRITWTNPSSGVVQGVAKSAGTPFAGMTNGLVFSGSGGASIAQATPVPNSSPSDVINPLNWLRNGASQLPQNFDDMVIANSSVPLLYNLAGLANVVLNSLTRWQSFTAQVGLPENNPNGYVEYLPTYFQIGLQASGSPSSGGSGLSNVVLGAGPSGNGPTRERYDFGSSQYSAAVIAAGNAADAYSVRILGTNTGNTVSTVGPSVGIGMLPGESANLLSASAVGGSIAIGSGVVFTGTLTLSNGTGTLVCAPGQIICQSGSSLSLETTAQAPALTYPSIIIRTGSVVTPYCGGNFPSLVLQTSSRFDASQDARAKTVGVVTIDADTCTINDPYNSIVWTGKVTYNNNLASGPIILGAGHSAVYT